MAVDYDVCRGGGEGTALGRRLGPQAHKCGDLSSSSPKCDIFAYIFIFNFVLYRTYYDKCLDRRTNKVLVDEHLEFELTFLI